MNSPSSNTSIFRSVEKILLRIRNRFIDHRQQIEKNYRSELDAARASKEAGAYDDLQYEMHFELGIIDETEAAELTNSLRKTARRLKIPMPPYWAKDGTETGYWETGSRLGKVYLSDDGVAVVREAIRAERKARREQWVPAVTALTGLIGAITGLIAIWSKN